MISLWMALQLVALALAAGRVPLSARFPEPSERLAAVEMLVVQLGAAALLFPLLLNSWKRFWLTLLGLWPMLYLAGSLAGNRAPEIISAGSYATAWIVTLAIWRASLPSLEAQKIAVVLASLWTIGGCVLLYLHMEYGNEAQNPAMWQMAFGPIIRGLNRLQNPAVFDWADLPMLFLFFAGIISSAIRRFKNLKIHDKLSTEL